MMYIILTILAIILGQLCKQICRTIPPVVAEEITYKEFFNNFKKDFKIDIKYSVILSIMFSGIYHITSNPLQTIIYSLVVFALMIVFSVDFRFELIPDECSVFISYMALIYICLSRVNILDALLGAVVGSGIFYLLGKLAILIFKKEGMGFGDVKLMFALGLLFGTKNILVLTLVSFFLGAIISCFLMCFKKKGADNYIPFGPFIVIAAIALMFIKADVFIDLYIGMCSGLSYLISDIMFKIVS